MDHGVFDVQPVDLTWGNEMFYGNRAQKLY
jgi:hypothetical protein